MRQEVSTELLDQMTLSEIKAMAVVAKEFEEATGMRVIQIMTAITNLANDEHGTSNKVVCGQNNVNHHRVIEYLQNKGWIDADKELTEKGFRDMNNADDIDNFNLREDTLVLQNYDGSLYWDMTNQHFDRVWALVYDQCSGDEYNVNLKSNNMPLSRQTKKLFKRIGIQLEDYDTNR